MCLACNGDDNNDKIVKSKILNALLVVTSLLGYLEWSGNSHSFLFEAEGEILSKLFVDPVSVFHPFTVLPMIGQLILLVTLFQKQPSKLLTYAGIAGLGFLLAFILVVGLLSVNLRIILSTIPFMIVSIAAIRHMRSQDRRSA